MIIDTQTSKDNACKKIQALDGVYSLDVKPYKNDRSLEQNAFYWKILREITEYIGEYNPSSMNEYFKDEFLGKDVIRFKQKVIERQISTKDLNTKEMSEYLEKIIAWCADVINLKLKMPTYE